MPKRRSGPRPHTLGVDDGPFVKSGSPEGSVPIVAVMMEGCDLVEAVARTRFPVDGPDATGFLATWIGSLRCRPALQAVFLGGVTVAGLGVVDVRALHDRLGVPVLVVNRKDPARHRLDRALRAARLEDRLALVERSPSAARLGPDDVWVAGAGVEPEAAIDLVRATRHKSDLPEPLRLAHLIARAYTLGESRGRP